MPLLSSFYLFKYSNAFEMPTVLLFPNVRFFLYLKDTCTNILQICTNHQNIKIMMLHQGTYKLNKHINRFSQCWNGWYGKPLENKCLVWAHAWLDLHDLCKCAPLQNAVEQQRSGCLDAVGGVPEGCRLIGWEERSWNWLDVHFKGSCLFAVCVSVLLVCVCVCGFCAFWTIQFLEDRLILSFPPTWLQIWLILFAFSSCSVSSPCSK